MSFRKKLKSTTVAMAIVMGTSNTIFAAQPSQRYTDVSADHWAHSAILNISDRGYMVGNTMGEYRPNSPMDKFETSRILALASGFRHANLTAEEEILFETTYRDNQALLQSKNNDFVRWNPTANREIAFLLGIGVLVERDLDHFIVINDGQEQLRALSRQEAAVFLVRLAGMSSAAASGSYAQLFDDDHLIDPANRHYVYFLRANGIVSGDAENNFNPNEAVSRAAFAVMLDRVLSFREISGGSVDVSVDHEDTYSVTGSISVLFPTMNAIQILTDGNYVIQRLSDEAVIFVNDFFTTFADLEQGMDITVLISDGFIVDIRANDAAVPTPPAQPQEETPPAQTLPTQPEEAPPAQTLPSPPQEGALPTPQPAPPVENRVLQTIQGVVINTNYDDRSIDIEIRFLTPVGGVISQVITYTLGQSFEIRQGSRDIAFQDISIGDIVTAKVWASTVYDIQVAERSRNFEATLIARNHNRLLNANVFVVLDEYGEIHEFVVPDDAILAREGSGAVSWNEIRIGDSLDLITEHTVLIEAYAFGSRSTIDGVIEEIHMTQGMTTIVVLSNNVHSRYYITESLEGSGNLRIGQRVRLRLDSREVEAFSILQSSS